MKARPISAQLNVAIAADLRRAVRIRAAEEGVTMRSMIERALRAFLATHAEKRAA